jgi:phosphoribosylformylglycinamidine synthase
MVKPRVCVLRTAGTNWEGETAFAFARVGADARIVHVNRFIAGFEHFSDYQILAIPGGFSYGDDVASGKIFANELRFKLNHQMRDFISCGKLIIGICNGFQILIKSGILGSGDNAQIQASLVMNDSGKFEDRWVCLKSAHSRCVWTKDIPDIMYLPVAHGEGKFITYNQQVLDTLKRNGQVVFQYCSASGSISGYPDNPNGSVESIAGLCDVTGRIFGLMPHPERHADCLQHPRWTAHKKQNTHDGLCIFKNGVDYARAHI